MAEARELVGTGDAARAVGVDRTTLGRWAKSGVVKPAIRTPGGHLKWDIEDLREQLRAMGALA